MRTTLILIISGILIGTGLSILWREIKKSRRSAFIVDRDARPLDDPPEVEITISPSPRSGDEPNPLMGDPAEAAAAPLSQDRDLPSNASNGRSAPSAKHAFVSEVKDLEHPTRPPGVEERWLALKRVIAAGLGTANAELAANQITINEPGDATWSYENRGYGWYHRILIAGESVGWLRLELTPDGALNANMKAHKDEFSQFNSFRSVPAEQLTSLRTSELLIAALESVVAYASSVQDRAIDSEVEASEQAWKSIEPKVSAALQATNGALAQAGARLLPISAASWEPEIGRHRMNIGVEVNGSDIAHMQIERLEREIEVAVGVRDRHLADLGRRRRIQVEGMTVHGLAELIASCAWPAIARFRENRRSA